MNIEVAERRFTVVDRPGETVTVTIGKPEIHPTEPEEWVCPFRVGDHVSAGRGVDGLQALIHAIQGARSYLDASGLSPSLVWTLDEPGNTGIPQMVPYNLGREFAERIERLIEREHEDFAARMARGDRGG